MFNAVQPPAPQALERRLWCNLEPRYWLYLAGALLTCVLDLAFGPGAWWQKALLCGVVLSLSALPAARWGGVHLDSHLWWEGHHAMQLLCAALSQRSATLWAVLWRHRGRADTRAPATRARASVAGKREARPCTPLVRWWQETDWDALDREAARAEAEAAAWDGAGAMREEDDEAEEDYRTDEARRSLEMPWAEEDAGAAGWVDDGVGTWQEEEAQGWVDDWASLPHTEQGPGTARPQVLPRRTSASARAAGLAWDAATASAYDPLALFLLDQSPCFRAPVPSVARQMLAGHTPPSREGWSVLGAEAKGA